MTAERPRLVVIRGDGSPDGGAVDALRRVAESLFEVVETEDIAAASRMAAAVPGSLILGHAGRIAGAAAGLQRAGLVVESIGQGVGLVDGAGEILWMNAALAACDPETLRRYADGCAEAIRGFNEFPPRNGMPTSRRVQFRSNGIWFEQIVSPAGSPGRDGAGAPPPGKVEAAVGVMWDVTASRRLQERIEAIEAAGEDLLRLDPQTITSMDLGQRLTTLERTVTQGLRTVLGFEEFEVRLLDRRSDKLELVIAVGIPPLGIGESIVAKASENGISGHVAATGRSYLCPDVSADPLYRGGLEGARSSLTVPLLLRDRVVGVLNFESVELERFDDEDRLLAELYGRYLALALNVFELLVAERTTTRESFADTVNDELKQPLEEISSSAGALRDRVGRDIEARGRVDQIVECVATVRARLDTCSQGPHTVLGVEAAMADSSADSTIAGKRVLVADDEPRIRQTLLAILARKGADVTVCRDGAAAIEQMLAAIASGRPFDLVISDVRMPDRNGYEVFRATKDAAPATPVILMTGFGYDPHHSIVRSSQEGLHCFLFKPFEATALLVEVRKAMSGRDSAG